MRLMLVDDAQGSTFARPDLALHQAWSLTTVSALSQVYEQVAAKSPAPDLAIAFQDRPKQFPQSEILRCYQAAPLLRIVLVLGPWCDGDLRTPGQIAGAHILRFNEAMLRLAEMVEDFRQDQGILVRPLTALGDVPPPSRVSGTTTRPLQVGVYLPKRLATGIAACLEMLGHTAVVYDELESDLLPVDLILVDGDADAADSSQALNVPIVSLEGFPRTAEHLQLAKQFAVDDLELTIQRAMGCASGAATTQAFRISR